MSGPSSLGEHPLLGDEGFVFVRDGGLSTGGRGVQQGRGQTVKKACLCKHEWLSPSY